jgi:thioredoxin
MITEVNDDNFEVEVLQSEKPVLVQFSATWCGPCKAMKPIVEKFAEENVNIKVFIIDIDNSPKTSSQYYIRSIPCLVLFKNGMKLGFQGSSNLADLKTFVETTLKNEQMTINKIEK